MKKRFVPIFRIPSDTKSIMSSKDSSEDDIVFTNNHKQKPSVSSTKGKHFKAFDLMILQYEIGIFQKSHIKVRITVFVWLKLTCIRCYVLFEHTKTFEFIEISSNHKTYLHITSWLP